MNTLCPCGCGRRIRLSPEQIRDVVTVSRSHWELDLATAYGCSVSTVRHLRQTIRGDGMITRSGR